MFIQILEQIYSKSFYVLKEDAHITNPIFEPDCGLFAVFDGHGGLECAKFCEKFFEAKLKE